MYEPGVAPECSPSKGGLGSSRETIGDSNWSAGAPLDPLVHLAQAVKHLASSGPTYDLIELSKLTEQVNYQLIRATQEMNDSGRWAAEGFLSAPSWLAQKCNLDRGSARSSVNLASKLKGLPGTSTAFASGAITRSHAMVIARADTPDRHDAIIQCETTLVDAAEHLPPKRIADICTMLTDALDGDDGASRDTQMLERRSFHLSQTLEGMWIGDICLDDESGRRLKAALDAAMERDFGATRGALSDSIGLQDFAPLRSPTQRRADALIALCESGATALRAGDGNRVSPHMTVVIDLADIAERVDIHELGAGEAFARSIRSHARLGAGLSKATLERICCDAKITRVLTDGPSVILDVGTTTRTISAAMRKALVVRDRGCVEPTCDRPVEWCEGHHKIPFSQGGATSLENLELRCRRHHQLAHDRLIRDRIAGAKQRRQKSWMPRAA